MSNFLTRLAQRQLGQMPTIQPRIPSLYVPQSEEAAIPTPSFANVYDSVPELEQKPAVRTHSTSHQESTSDPATLPVASGPIPTSEKPTMNPHHPQMAESAQPVETLSEEYASHVLRENSHQTESQRSFLLKSPDSQPAMSVDVKKQQQIPIKEFSAHVETLVVSPKTTVKTEPAQPLRLVEQKLSDQPARKPYVDRLVSLVTPQSIADHFQEKRNNVAEPPVHVTIGRIEVTAVTAAPTPKRTPSPRKASMSLDDYLAKRGGRKR